MFHVSNALLRERSRKAFAFLAMSLAVRNIQATFVSAGEGDVEFVFLGGCSVAINVFQSLPADE